jgi:hypothetical protein
VKSLRAENSLLIFRGIAVLSAKPTSTASLPVLTTITAADAFEECFAITATASRVKSITSAIVENAKAQLNRISARFCAIGHCTLNNLATCFTRCTNSPTRRKPLGMLRLENAGRRKNNKT